MLTSRLYTALYQNTICRAKAAALKSENMFSLFTGLCIPFVSIVHTVKRLLNLEQLDIIGSESLEEIPRQNSRVHVAGALAELCRKMQSGQGRM